VVLCRPEVAFAHPLDGGRAAAVEGSVAATASGLGADGPAYVRLMGPLVAAADQIVPEVLAPLRSVPRHPFSMARFGLVGLRSVAGLARRFDTDEARALLAGVGAHSMLPLETPVTGAFAVLLAMLAHHAGWPVVQGGSARLVDALTGELASAGARLSTERWVADLDELPPSRAVLLDVAPGRLVALAGDRLPAARRRSLARFVHGPGICKVDWALSGPVPWAAEACRRTATVHVGGTFEEVARAEDEVAAGRHPERPFTIVVQPGVVDPSRAPGDSQTLWAYCHVPAGSDVDMTERIERQIERFAPGFSDLVLARSTRRAVDVAASNPNYVGGDINGGQATLRQTLFRPVTAWNQYRMAPGGPYLCSSSTPPGGGVHGMCGEWAARTALRDLGVGDPLHTGGRGRSASAPR
jgi:phytoene dehydrogenase-like protein